jgi:glycosyltransferase involved in cell wall biosynthesis
MKILLVHLVKIPVFSYGGTERVIWDLAKGLASLGHEVTFLVPSGSSCPFARILEIDPERPVCEQIPRGAFDIAHFQSNPGEPLDFPYLVTEHGNSKRENILPPNTVFVSIDHAKRYGSTQYVYNGLDWASYGEVDWNMPRVHCHFLGKGSWPVKNLKGAIQVARKAGQQMAVLGANRLSVSRALRFTPWPSIRFHGMVGGETKFRLLNQSTGLVFPVRWHEPFGLAVIESLFFGCPVFATPYGALPEIVQEENGVLLASADELAEAMCSKSFDRRACHQRALKGFNHMNMALGYLEKYQRIVDGETLNPTCPVLNYNGHKLLDWQP